MIPGWIYAAREGTMEWWLNDAGEVMVRWKDGYVSPSGVDEALIDSDVSKGEIIPRPSDLILPYGL